MQKRVLFATVFLLMSSVVFSQDFASKFRDLSSKNDTSGQAELLSSWTKTSPNDPELYIAYLNYFVEKSSTGIISLDRTQRNSNSFIVADTGSGKAVAYLNYSTKYKSDLLQQGFNYIDQGIALHPARLDMRFGKIYMLGQAENYPEFTKESIATIDYGNKINNEWLWKEGKPLENTKRLFLSSIQDYIGTIYNTEDDSLLPLMRQISETVLRYYPDHVESLSNVALTHLLAKDYDKALPYLLKAERIAPGDVIVLNNIAEAYKRKADKTNAKLYYEKVIKYGNKDEIEDAQERIKRL